MVRVLGVPVSEFTEDQVFEQCVDFMHSTGPHILITAGPEFVMRARRDPAVMEVAERADLVTPDGIGVVMAARWYGRLLAGRVTGVDLSVRLIDYADRAGLRVYLLGAAEASLQNALSAMRKRRPTLNISGRNGYFTPDRIEEVVRDIEVFRPHLLLAGLGQPRQEIFLTEHRERLSVPLAMGVGGAIDVLGGTVKRAPDFFQRTHLEWFYRLVRDPRRWRRQAVLPQFAAAAWRDSRKSRGQADVSRATGRE